MSFSFYLNNPPPQRNVASPKKFSRKHTQKMDASPRGTDLAPVSIAKLTPPLGFTDSLDSYLHERAFSTPLLTPTEEIELAHKIQRGDEAARERMVLANLRLVVKIARDYENNGVPVIDLINEGNIGLMRAVDRFDPSKGAKLSTYASWWIKQAIKRALSNQGKTIRVPIHRGDLFRKIIKFVATYEQKNKIPPSDELIAEEFDISTDALVDIRSASQPIASLHAPLGSDPDAETLESLIEDPKAGDPRASSQCGDLIGHMREILESSIISNRDRDILERRFGLRGGKEETLEEIGKTYGLTRERIRQLEAVAMKKIKERLLRKDEVVDPTYEKFLADRKS